MTRFSVLSWNVQGIRTYARTDFQKAIPGIDNSEADIICLQEVPFAFEKIKLLKKKNKYCSVISKYNRNPCEDTSPLRYNHNVILTKYPMLQSGEIIFSSKIKSILFENAIWSDIKINKQKIRVYNCHFRISGVGIKERIWQLRQVIMHASAWKHPVIICGDMNTTIPQEGLSRKVVQLVHSNPGESIKLNGAYFRKDERFAFNAEAKRHGFNELLSLDKATWALPGTSWEIFGLKLDWFLAKKIKRIKSAYGKYISDHRAITVKCELE